MKNYADGVLRILDGTSSRLLQVERAANNLRQSVSSLKDSVDDYYDQTNKNYGKLNEHVMEVMLRENSKMHVKLVRVLYWRNPQVFKLTGTDPLVVGTCVPWRR